MLIAAVLVLAMLGATPPPASANEPVVRFDFGDQVGQTAPITVTFRPTTAGARSASLVIAGDVANSPPAVPLTGTGVAAPPPQADLGVSIGATPNPVRTGTTLTFTITVGNFGPSTATGVVLTEQLPAESKFVSYMKSNGSCTAPAPGETGTLTCQLGSLALVARRRTSW